MQIVLTNYRCFCDQKPARLDVRPGLTALIGPNNSGKSSVIRFLYELRHVFAIAVNDPGMFLQAFGNPVSFSPGQGVLDPEELFCDRNMRSIQIDIDFSDLVIPAATLPIITRVVITIPRGTTQFSAQAFTRDGLLETAGGAIGFANGAVPAQILRINQREIADTTVLRTALDCLSRTFYVGPFRNAINIGGHQRYFDISVGNNLIDSWGEYRLGNNKFRNRMAGRLIEDIRHIFGFQTLDISPSQDRQSLQATVDGRPYKFHELGSGLAHFFITLANVAIQTPAPSFILIDEPELGLHPSLQLDFLTTLASYAESGVFFATHGYGLARSAGNRVYTVTRDAGGCAAVAPLETTERLSELLGELSFAGYRELGYDRILLVEGPTEVTTFHQLLRLYGKDHKIVLLPLGGASLINGRVAPQLEELKRISENVAVVIDSERSTVDEPLAVDRAAFVQVCAEAGIPCKVLKRRAIENYFPEHAIRSALRSEQLTALDDYGKLGRAWAKSENWRIARAMTLQDLENDLGVFLAGL